MARTLKPQMAALLLKQIATALRRDFAPADVVAILSSDPFLDSSEKATVVRLSGELAAGKPLGKVLADPNALGLSSAAVVGMAPTPTDEADVLDSLADDYADLSRVRTVVRVALVWPLVVLVWAAIVCSVVLIFVIPAFSNLYAGFGVELPAATRLVTVVFPPVVECIVIVALLLLVLRLAVYQDGFPAAIVDRTNALFDGVPYVRGFREAQCAQRLVRWLKVTASSGALRDAAIGHMEVTTASPALRRALSQVRASLSSGASLHAAIAGAPALSRRVALYAELGAKMDDIAASMAQLQFMVADDEALALRKFEAGLIATMYFFVGVIVAFLVAAIYLPIFQVGRFL